MPLHDIHAIFLKSKGRCLADSRLTMHDCKYYQPCQDTKNPTRCKYLDGEYCLKEESIYEP
jgi:hypothetical protein